ncbi:TolC family protein [Geomonas sp.]|uniref:TolC family protein n=1 Tax=Geomonas sp. TaxID=2651584 RepID=UPI002B4A8C2F|nr:TolC family protein [Geomonas sp.]HJV35557.1 TolC family protein [Geomonas sp.]
MTLVRNISILALLAFLWQAGPACGERVPPAPLRLTLEQAIRRGIDTNLALITAVTRVAEAEGSHERQLAKYLPHARLEPSFTYQSINIRALGINFAGSPSIVGPFTTWDFRAYADQSIIDLQAYHQIKASGKDKQARVQDFRDVRNQVIREVAGQYLQVQSLLAQAEAAQSRVATSETLEKLARDQHDVGVATGVDVLRAQVQLANDRQSLMVAQNAVKQSVMMLARTIGLSPGTPLVLAEPLAYKALEAPQIEEAVTDALKQRADYRSLSLQHDSLEEQLKASRARYYPKLTLSANYGGNGPTLGDLQQTGLVKVDLQFTIFDLDREGERKELQSRLQRVEAQIADERRGIEQDVRGALLNLESSGDQVKVAQEGLTLAERELTMAEDRFRHGVADNIEVVNAQDALARAQQNRILALTGYADAKIALARALGDTEMTYRSFLGIQ